MSNGNDPDIEKAIVRRRDRLEGASQERHAAQAAREAKVAAFRRQAEDTILPELALVVEQVTKEIGISAEVVDELDNASPWMALKLRVPPRTAEVRFTFDLEQNVVTVRTTGEGESSPRLDRKELSELTSAFVHDQARDAFVHAAT
jgi:hypothetical protein